MTNLKSGFIAGFIATVVLSVLMVMKGIMGVMPELDVAAMLAAMIDGPEIAGWIAHFMIGTFAWGGAFAVFYDMIPGSSAVQKGIVFGILDWLGMMILIMPIAGAGFFGLGMGIMVPVLTLVLHICLWRCTWCRLCQPHTVCTSTLARSVRARSAARATAWA